REFAHAIGRGGTLPARSDHAKVGIIGLPQHQISGSPSQCSDSCQLIGGINYIDRGLFSDAPEARDEMPQVKPIQQIVIPA
ncbi:MAG TPA: hypothetical protein VK192_05975, partial [Sphingomicrobium sp.]|nr:hypothetical protein [Sphingomicrobium sp.]